MHLVDADHLAHAQGVHAHLVRGAGLHAAAAANHLRLGANLLHRIEEHLCRAAGRVRLVLVVGLHDLNVRLREEARRLPGHAAQLGHTHGHVAAVEQRNALRCGMNAIQLRRIVAGGGDDHRAAPRLGRVQQCANRAVVGEVDDRVGLGGLRQIGQHLNAVALCVHFGGKLQPGTLPDQPDQLPAHAPAGAVDDDFHPIRPSLRMQASRRSRLALSMGVSGRRSTSSQ